jgi:hypothetical protein
MGDTVLRIEKLTNGYEVEICDSKIMDANRKPKSVYEDPWKSYAFTTAEEVKAFVGEHLDSLKPPPEADEEYAQAFKQASTEDE